MSLPLTQILALTLIPVTATIIGGSAATYRKPTALFRSFVQHFAAGVVFAVVAGELIPEITRSHQTLGIVLGFTLGVATMLAIQKFAAYLESRGGEGNSKSGLLAAVGIDLLLDGLLIGVGFSADARVGTLLIIALTLEMLFLGVSVASSLGEAGVPKGRTILTITALGCSVLVGALVGSTLLRGLEGLALATVLSFGAAALMFLVTEELLMEAHEVKETPLITAAFFAGFVALYLLELA